MYSVYLPSRLRRKRKPDRLLRRVVDPSLIDECMGSTWPKDRLGVLSLFELRIHSEKTNERGVIYGKNELARLV